MLIDFLWESLDEERVREIEAKWAAESEERIDAVDRGELETIDGPSALRDLRSDRQEITSTTSPKPTETQMEKPQIYTTESGSQYVRAIDVVRSKAGWAEIQRLMEADLVRSQSANSTSNENR